MYINAQRINIGRKVEKFVTVLPNFRILSQDLGLFNIKLAEPKTRSIEQQNSNDQLSDRILLNIAV